MLKKYTHTTCTEIGEKKVKLGGVMEASGLGGNCFKSMLMEISEFQKTQTITLRRGGPFAGSECTEHLGICTGVLGK